jgi:hypothetical protein
VVDRFFVVIVAVTILVMSVLLILSTQAGVGQVSLGVASRAAAVILFLIAMLAVGIRTVFNKIKGKEY